MYGERGVWGDIDNLFRSEMYGAARKRDLIDPGLDVVQLSQSRLHHTAWQHFAL